MIFWSFVDLIAILLLIANTVYLKLMPDNEYKMIVMALAIMSFILTQAATIKIQKLLLTVEEQKHKRFYLINARTGEKIQVSESTFYAAIQIDKKFSNIVQMRSNHEK